MDRTPAGNTFPDRGAVRFLSFSIFCGFAEPPQEKRSIAT